MFLNLLILAIVTLGLLALIIYLGNNEKYTFGRLKKPNSKPPKIRGKNMRKKNKELLVAVNVLEVDKGTKRKPATLKLTMTFPHYLKEANETAQDLLNKLIGQSLGGDIIIQGLTLSWYDNSVEKKEEGKDEF